MIKFKTQKLRQSGNALVVKLPTEWVATHNVRARDPLYSVLRMDRIIRVYLFEVEWSRATNVRPISKNPHLTIRKPHVEALGLTKDSVVAIEADDNVLLISLVKTASPVATEV